MGGKSGINSIFKDIKIVILAGGLAKRLGKLTKKKPKSLIKINKVEFIDYQLEWIKKNKIYNVIICCGHLEDKLKKHLKKKNYFLNIKFISDGKKLLGTAGSVKNCIDYLSDHFFVINGDTFPLIKLQNLKKKIYNNNFKSTITITRSSKKNLVNNLKIKGNHIIEYKKSGKEKFDYIDYGVQFFKKNDFLKATKNYKKCDFEFVYRNLIAKNKLFYYKTRLNFFEIGSFTGIKEISNYLRK